MKYDFQGAFKFIQIGHFTVVWGASWNYFSATWIGEKVNAVHEAKFRENKFIVKGK